MEKALNVTNNQPSVAKDRVLVARHFEDVDDLREGLDTALDFESPNFKNNLLACSQEIIKHTREKGYERILLISSPRQRARQTAEQIKSKIKDLDDELVVHTRVDERFAELDHGEIVLPEDYVPGRRIGFLKEAWVAFWQETFTEEGEYNNPSYKFGDPIDLGDGLKKYPELAEKFSSLGEDYNTLSTRYYEALLDYLRNKSRLDDMKVNPVLIAHSATLSILTELRDIAAEISRDHLKIQQGNLMNECWLRYLRRIDTEGSNIDFATMRSFDISDISDEAASVLEKEIEYLKHNNV